MLFANHIDSLAAAGILLADIWGHKQLVAVDQLCPDFLTYGQDGQTVNVTDDGTVTVC
jgi:hypothetical protein